ncbi:hypothetical protein [Streptomyces sp. T12]|uniref:hypothetical protein n=1 Tax=Streptomyces sp. T12 TaxID=477697 RepID=UPI00164650E3|nr:hypothetical protein [Streptomyces sp. T12]
MAWPMFTVPLVGGFTIVLHYNSGEEFTTTDYFLTHPDWNQDLGFPRPLGCGRATPPAAGPPICRR